MKSQLLTHKLSDYGTSLNLYEPQFLQLSGNNEMYLKFVVCIKSLTVVILWLGHYENFILCYFLLLWALSVFFL